jgi:hypothetical protein
VHEIKTRQLVALDSVHHRRIRAVRDGLAKARFLAFELKPKPALSRRLVSAESRNAGRRRISLGDEQIASMQVCVITKD